MKRLDAEIVPQILDLACQIQQIPGPTFFEQERSRFLAESFRRNGLSEVEIDPLGNVFARLPGGSAKPLVVSAHLDTVHPIEVDLTLTRSNDQISGPGIGDNSLGLAALVGMTRAWCSDTINFPGDLWLVANVSEEGLGNLNGMQAVVNRFGSKPLAYLIIEGIGLGNIYHQGLGVIRFKISVKTPGGHSWADYGRPSAIHELARLVTRLIEIDTPVTPRTTINVGTIQGGTSVNTIAANAQILLDLRSEDDVELENLTNRVRKLAADSIKPGVEIKLEQVGKRPAGWIPARHPLVKLAIDSLIHEGITPVLGIASTDANIPLSRGIPAICIGLTSGGNAHTTAEYILTRHLFTGLNQLNNIVMNAWETASAG